MIFSPYIRSSVEMPKDTKFKKMFYSYQKDTYAVFWMWSVILAEASKFKGFFVQSEGRAHDDLSLLTVFDMVGVTHGLDFIKKVIEDFCSPEYEMLCSNDGLLYVTKWDKWQHSFLSTPRVEKYRANETLVTEILEMFNTLTGKKFKIKNNANREMVRGRLKDGFTKEDFQKVIVWKIKQWGNDPKMCMYIRPDTLFRPSKFDAYLNEIPKAGQLAMIDIAASAMSSGGESLTTFSVVDMYGRRRIITQEQFDKAEPGYFTKT